MPRRCSGWPGSASIEVFCPPRDFLAVPQARLVVLSAAVVRSAGIRQQPVHHSSKRRKGACRITAGANLPQSLFFKQGSSTNAPPTRAPARMIQRHAPSRPRPRPDHLPGLGRQLPDLGPRDAGDPAAVVHRAAVRAAGVAAAVLDEAARRRAMAAADRGGLVRGRAAFRAELHRAEAGRRPVLSGHRDAELRADDGAAGVGGAGRALWLAHRAGDRGELRRGVGARLRSAGAGQADVAGADAGVGVVPGHRHRADEGPARA